MASPGPKRNFYETVSAAIRDFAENGFDSANRLEFWSAQIREAAERSARSPHQMEEMLRAGLSSLYRKLIESGKIARHHPGIARYTIDKLRPELRAELDRRILASASLIKLNREEAIDKTLQRFRGWATSIPAGGSRAADKGKTDKDVRKALVRLPFEERRVLIDQGHKLTANISEVVAKGGDALAAVWNSHWRQAGYDYREDHKERDKEVYLLRDSWARSAGLVRTSDAGYYDDITRAGEEPFCRCFIRWIYNLRDLPPDMLTEKGRRKLAEVRAAMTSGDLVRKDAVGRTLTKNVGIVHLARITGGAPVCGNRGAHSTFSREKFSEQPDEFRCARCQVKLAGWDLIRAKRPPTKTERGDGHQAG